METGTPREKGKTRSRRIPLGYLERNECADPLIVRRSRLAMLAVVLAAGAVVYVTAVPGGLRIANHGAVIDAHASFEQDCALCHRPESPKVGGAGDKESPAPHFHASDAACARCHHAPAHFRHDHLDGKEPSCFACHHDHQGRAVDLKRTVDANCNVCHADPKGWVKRSEMGAMEFAKAEAFSADLHPQFSTTKASEQKFIFNHAVHLAPGLKVGFAYEKLPTDHRLRTGRDASAAVQLDCAACHERVAAGRSGDDFAPVKYDRHCADCHPLTVPSYAAEKASAKHTKSVGLRHGVDGARLRDQVTGLYAKQALDGNPTLRRALEEGDPKIKDALVGREKLKPENAKIAVKAKETLRGLLGAGQACGKCHHAQPVGGNEEFSLTVMKAAIPDRWWTRARFSHAAHSSDCASCHRTATGLTAANSVASADVLMPTLQSCLACHDAGKSSVRADCVLCHGYHGIGLPEGAGKHHHLTPRGAEVRR